MEVLNLMFDINYSRYFVQAHSAKFSYEFNLR